MKNLKKLTLLHSNDMHGDFLAEQVALMQCKMDKMIGTLITLQDAAEEIDGTTKGV
ncbi:MAG: hypothetical protein K6G87_05940 [Butyrivibrio sp.]|uniref:hypothetical protein n=1 Tax=Butyrivibrio sp. TaxID=28121 RepID=UPI0025D075DF|nr:hypothetical protein [Butyrivibrio sp.]MCR5770764.1 hypothetical protein [Butyrivibrio sp.]